MNVCPQRAKNYCAGSKRSGSPTGNARSCKKQWTREERRSQMAIALDTSVLVAWEKAGGLPTFLEAHEGPFYVPAHAAAEFLLGTHPHRR
jgi:hypothetical protein